MKSSPDFPYALIQLMTADGVENPVVEDIELSVDDILETGETFHQTPWGTSLIRIEIDFFKDDLNNRALEAATRMKNALALEERLWDLWEIMGLVGSIQLRDISAAFRYDSEGRAQIRFDVYANLSLPEVLDDNYIYDIDTQTVNVIHVREDGLETEIEVPVENTEN